MNPFASPVLAEYCRGALHLGLGALLQSTLLIALGLLAAAALRRHGPMMGVVVYKTTLASVVAVALLSTCCASYLTPLWHVSLPAVRTAGSGDAPVGRFRQTLVPSFGAAGEPASAAHARGGAARHDGAMLASPSSLADRHAQTRDYLIARAEAQSARHWPVALYVAAAALWALGAGLWLGWLAGAQLFLTRLRARSAPVETGPAAEMLQALCAARNIERPLLLASDRVHSPFLTGLRRPAILLPAAYATEFEAPALRAILAHEVAHLAQRDCAWNLLGHVACGVGWVQPLLWLLRRRMEQASEVVCDQAVIHEHCSPREYARCLVDLAERFLPGARERALGVGVVPERSSLGQRVQQIVAGPRIGSLRLTARQRAAVTAGALAAVVSGVFLISSAGPTTHGTERLMALASAAPVGTGAEEALTKPHGPLSGMVVTPDGKPVSGAEVFWTSREDRETQIRSTVKTDAAGRFHFADADRLRAVGTQPKLLVLADGWGATFWDLLHETGEPAIPLAPATTLRVPFLGLDGQPVAGLAVRPRLLLESRAFGQLPEEIGQRFVAHTDDHGIASLSGLPQGAKLQLQTSDARFAQLDSGDERPLAAAPVTEAKPIGLKPAAAIHGRILYGATGKPAAGIRVGAQGTDLDRGWGDAVTDAEGKYHMQQLGAGSYNVALDLRGELAKSWTARAHERLVVTVGEHPESVDFRLIPGAVVTGKLLAADNGEPIAGGHVSIYGPAHPRSSAWVQGTRSEADGTYFFRVPPGPQHLYISSAVSPPGFLAPVEQSRDLVVQDGSTTTVDFRFPRGSKPPRPVLGRVVGPDGAAVVGAEVVVKSSVRSPRRDTVRRTGADGAFALEAELVAQPVTLRARQGNLGTERSVVATAGDRVTLRLHQNVLVTLTGMVTDPAARSLAGAEIDLLEYGDHSGKPIIGWPIRRATTDAQGQFTLTGLWPDAHYSVLATAAGHGQQRSALLDDLQSGATRALEPLVLPKADRFVAGRVVDEAGKPLAGISVGIGGRETPPSFQTTDREGRFRFVGVVDEEVTLQAKGEGDRWQRQRVPAGTLDAVLTLSREVGKKEPT